MTQLMTKGTTTDADASGVVPEQIGQRPSKAKVLDAIVREADVNRSVAGAFLVWFGGVVKASRAHANASYLLSQREIKRFHGTLEEVIPDDTVAKPGTGHDLLERYLLDPDDGELSIRHTRREAGGARHCTIDIRVEVYP